MPQKQVTANGVLAVGMMVFASVLAGCGKQASAPESINAQTDSENAAVTSRSGVPPNVIVFFADDMGYGDLGSYGHPYIRTPHLDALANAGQRWTDFYVAAPVCSPSRGALLTGRLPTRTGLYGRRINVLFPNDTVGMPATETTLAEALKSAGYQTAIIGKWHLGDAPEVYPTRHGFDYWFGLPYSNDMDWTNAMTFDELMVLATSGKPEDTKRMQEELGARQALYFDPHVESWNVPLIRSALQDAGFTDEIVERPTDQRTLTRRYTQEALRFIDRSVNADVVLDSDPGTVPPFFLYLPYTMPHTPLFRSAQFAGQSRGGRYGDVIEEIDWSVGQIVDHLTTLGIDDNTVIVFTSDNGPWRSMRHHAGTAGLLKDGKGTTFEGGMRVPAIFSWPGNIARGVVSDIGSTLDLYSTVLSLAGITSPNSTDGVDLSATLLKLAPSARDTMPYYRAGELRAFRKGPYKLHLITEGAYGLPPARTDHEVPLLYHLGQDPAEQFDIAGEHPEVVADLLKAVAAHRAELAEEAAPLFDQRLMRAVAGE